MRKSARRSEVADERPPLVAPKPAGVKFVRQADRLRRRIAVGARRPRPPPALRRVRAGHLSLVVAEVSPQPRGHRHVADSAGAQQAPRAGAVLLPAVRLGAGAVVALGDADEAQLAPHRRPGDPGPLGELVQEADEVGERLAGVDEVHHRHRPLAARQRLRVDAEGGEVAAQLAQPRGVVPPDVPRSQAAHREQHQRNGIGPGGPGEDAGQVVEKALGRPADEQQVAIRRGRDHRRTAPAQVIDESFVRRIGRLGDHSAEGLAARHVPPERDHGHGRLHGRTTPRHDRRRGVARRPTTVEGLGSTSRRRSTKRDRRFLAVRELSDVGVASASSAQRVR